jgi:hypothetical protein
MITQEEMEKKLAEARIQQQYADFGKVWFTEALAHTGQMVQRGEFPQEAHQVGVICYQQFMGVKPAEEKKPEE